MKIKKKTIVLDMDGVLVDLLPSFLKTYNTIFDDNKTESDIKTWKINKYTKPEISKYVENIFKLPGFYENLHPVHSQRFSLDEIIIKLKRKYHVVIATDPYVEEIDLRVDIMHQKLKWIKKYLPSIDIESEVFFTNDKGMIDGDYIVDDSPLHLTNFIESGSHKKGLLFANTTNEEFICDPADTQVKRVYGWHEILNYFLI